MFDFTPVGWAQDMTFQLPRSSTDWNQKIAPTRHAHNANNYGCRARFQGWVVSMTSAAHLCLREDFHGHSAALLPKNLYVSPPKLVCIAARKRLKMQAIRLIRARIQQILVRIAAIKHPTRCTGVRGGKILWSNAALPPCDQKK